MPVLGKQELPYKKITLPSSTDNDPAWVEVWEKIKTGSLVEIKNLNENKDAHPYEFYKYLIRDWNFVTETGEKAQINGENIAMLDSDDFAVIVDNCNALNRLNEVALSKKNALTLSAISQQNKNENLA